MRRPRSLCRPSVQALDPGARARYAGWAATINEREPITVADRYEIVSDRQPIPLDEVEPVWKILDDRDGLGRICGGAMSWGSLSDEAHEDIAIAMNRVGANPTPARAASARTATAARPTARSSRSPRPASG